MLHAYLVPDHEARAGFAEYAAVATGVLAAVNVGTCLAVRAGSSMRVFEAASGAAVAAACAATLLARGTFFPRQVLVTALMCAWGARLSRLLYVHARKKEVANVGARVLWGALCCAPAVVCNVSQRRRYRSTAVELLALGGAVASLALEHVADRQKQAWHAAHAESGRPGRGDAAPPVCAAGLWAWSRHPNLFFELSFHWFVYLIVRPVEEPLVLFFPTALTVMVVAFPGGLVSQEMQRAAAYSLYPAYVHYASRTPDFFPRPPLKWGSAEQTLGV